MKEKFNDIPQLIFKLLIVIVGIIGLVLNFKLAPVNELILYFTILSNLACVIFYSVSFVLYFLDKLKNNNVYYLIKGLITICVTLTMLMYNLVLTGGELYQGHEIACAFVHLFTPGLVILDYFIFGEKGNLKIKYPFIWSIALLVYVMFCWGYSFCGGSFGAGSKYPYFFMDVEKYGIPLVIVFHIIIYILFILLGYLTCYIDKKMAHSRNSQKERSE